MQNYTKKIILMRNKFYLYFWHFVFKEILNSRCFKIKASNNLLLL